MNQPLDCKGKLYLAPLQVNADVATMKLLGACDLLPDSGKNDEARSKERLEHISFIFSVLSTRSQSAGFCAWHNENMGLK